MMQITGEYSQLIQSTVDFILGIDIHLIHRDP